MDINSLEYFMAIAKYGNILKAAEALYLSPSTVSRALAKLEDEVGTSLFYRTKNNTGTITEAGKMMLEYSAKIVEDFEAMKRGMSEYLGKGSITIASVSSYPIRNIIGKLMVSETGYKVSTLNVNRAKIERFLMTNQADICIDYEMIKNEEIYNIPIMTTRLFISVPLDNPLSVKNKVNFSDLKTQTFLRPKSSDVVTSLLKDKLSGCDLIEVGDEVLFRQMLPNTPYLATAGSLSLDYFSSLPNRKVIPIADDYDFRKTYYVIYKKRNEKKLDSFLKWLYEYLQSDDSEFYFSEKRNSK